jgi:hypothetical protein
MCHTCVINNVVNFIPYDPSFVSSEMLPRRIRNTSEGATDGSTDSFELYIVQDTEKKSQHSSVRIVSMAYVRIEGCYPKETDPPMRQFNRLYKQPNQQLR